MCCTREIQATHCVSPFGQSSKFLKTIDQADNTNTIFRVRRSTQTYESYVPGLDQKKYGMVDNRRPEEKAVSAKQLISFALQLESKIKFVSFSQRRFIGFRKRYEFDKKRLLLASNDELTIVGYD